MIKKYLKALSDIPRFPYICERWDKIINGKYELKIEEFIYSTDNDLFRFLDKEQALHSAIYYINNLENNFSKIDETDKTDKTDKTEILKRLIKLFNEYLLNLKSLDEAKDFYGASNVCEVNIAVFICVFCKYGYVKEVINELDQYNGKINLYCSDIVSSTLMTIADYYLIVKQDIEFSSVIYGLFDNLHYGENVSKNAIERFYIKLLLSSLVEVIKKDNLPWNSEILLRVDKEFIEKYKLIKLQNKNPKLVFEQYLGLYYELSNKCRVIEETSKLRFNYICIMFLLQDMLEIVIRHDYSDICKIDNEDVKVLLDTVVKFAGKHNKAITELIRKCRLGNTIDEKALCFIVHNMFLIQDIVKYIKEELLVVHDNSSMLYYYSTLSTLRYMLPEKCAEFETKKNLGNLKLMHIAYMNDPAEGNVLCKQLGIPQEWIDENGNVKEMPYVFIKCFSRQEDYLPMWNLYGDKGKGCCLELQWNSQTFKLYHVAYINKNSNSLIKENNQDIDIENINQNINELKVFITQCQNSISDDYKEILNKELTEIIKSIRFLFKDDSYSYEKEIRCVIVPPNTIDLKKFELLGNGNVPKLGITISKLFKIKRIILGSRFENVIDCLPFLQQQIELMSKELSYEKPNVSISKLEFR